MTDEKPKRVNNIKWAGVIGLAGCLGLAVALLALVLGLWLDSLIGQRGPATICLLVLSVPINLYLMVKAAVVLTRYFRPLESSLTIEDDEEV